MKLYRVDYRISSGSVLSCIPTQDHAEAEQLKSKIPGAWITEYDFEIPTYETPTCLKCGTTKVRDLFKGEYCPRCNDWF